MPRQIGKKTVIQNSKDHFVTGQLDIRDANGNVVGSLVFRRWTSWEMSVSWSCLTPFPEKSM